MTNDQWPMTKRRVAERRSLSQERSLAPRKIEVPGFSGLAFRSKVGEDKMPVRGSGSALILNQEVM